MGQEIDMKHSAAGAGHLLLCLILAAAFFAEQLPAAGEKSIVRAAVIGKENGRYEVGLFRQVPDSAANSADAEEKLALVWGSGETLAKAYQQAEAGFSGEAAYSLCNLIWVCGTAPNHILREETKWIQQSGKGLLASRVLTCAESTAAIRRAAETQKDFCEQFYAVAEPLRKNAPRLYAAAERSMPMPLLELDNGKLKKSSYERVSNTDKQFYLTEESASVLRVLQGGKGRIVLYGPAGDLSVFTVASIAANRMGKVEILLYGIADGLPEATEVRRDARQSLQRQIAAAALGLLQAAARQGIDLCDFTAVWSAAGFSGEPAAKNIECHVFLCAAAG